MLTTHWRDRVEEVFQDRGLGGRDQALRALQGMTWTRGTIMIFDALTIAGIFSAVLSGGFLFAAATLQAPRGSVRRPSRGDDIHQRS